MNADINHPLSKDRIDMNSKRTDNAGFTLIELMIGIAIFALVVAGVVGAFYDQL